MDPLSIIAAVLGILAVAAKVNTTLTTAFKNMERSPISAQCLLREIADLTACVSQVQAFLSGEQEADQSRKQLLMVEQLVVALSHCVLTMSELDQFLDSLKMTSSFSARTRLRWVREEDTVAGILIRLQASKSSLNLMLTTLTCSSVKEARSAVSALVTLVNDVLESNHELALRLYDVQLQIGGYASRLAASTWRVPLESIGEASTIRSTKSLAGESSALLLRRPLSRDDFDQNLRRDLSESQVYARNRHRFSLASISMSPAESLSWSFLSNCSLAAVSNISVIRLPIYSCDLWNPQHYLISDSERDETLVDRIPSDSASVVTAMTGIDSLVDNLLVRDAPDYKVALLGTNLGGNSTTLMLLYLEWSSDAVRGKQYAESKIILQSIQATFLNLEELIKDHKLQVDRETLELLQKVKSFGIGSSVTSDQALIELCQRLCQDRDIRIAIEWECPTFFTGHQNIISRHENAGLGGDEILFLERLRDLLQHVTHSNKDILHMLSSTTGRNRTTFKPTDGHDHFSIEITSITAPQKQFTTHILAGVDHIFYVVPLCSYCSMPEDTLSRNLMEVCLELFSSMTRLEDLRDTQITIFFTQADIFPQRIVDVPIHDWFQEFRGGADAQAAYQYFVDQFLVRDHREDAQVHMFAPGLDGLTSLQDTLDKLQILILWSLRSRQQIAGSLGTEIGWTQ